MNIEEYLKRQNELLERLSKINSDDFKTKKEIIEELIDATRPLVESGYYQWPKKFFASFIFQQLEQYNIEYPRGETFYSLFHEHEKREERTNFESLNEIHEHKFEGTDDVKKCECGAIQFESLIYGVEPPKEKTEVKTKISETEKKDPFSNPYTEYIQRVKFNCDELGSQCNDFIKKYYSDENIAKAMESVLQKIDSLIEEQKGIEAKLIHMSKQSDYRQKIGEWEKIKVLILSNPTCINVAKVAKLLSITPKHASKNIRQNMNAFLNNMKWFRGIHIEMKKDMKKGEILFIDDFNDWYNENVERKVLGLDMIQLNKY